MQMIPVRYEDSYEGQLRKLVGNRRLILPAARVIIVDSEKNLLLIKRKDNRKWGFPAGSLELNESIMDCAKREVKEETGLDLLSADVLAIYSEPRFQYTNDYGNKIQLITTVFLATAWNGKLIRETNETVDSGFYSVAEIGKMDLMPIYHETVDDYVKYSGKIILK